MFKVQYEVNIHLSRSFWNGHYKFKRLKDQFQLQAYGVTGEKDID